MDKKPVISLYACTDKGVETAQKIAKALYVEEDAQCTVSASRDRAKKFSGVGFHEDGIKGWTQLAFNVADAIIFVSSTGIAVRSIAPFLESKDKDPGVVVTDEAGKSVVSLVSGHIGGSVALAQKIAEILGAKPIVTTATDLRGETAVDTWAVEHDYEIDNVTNIVSISAAQLDKERVGVAVTEKDIQAPFEKTLFIRPKNLWVGIGCKRDADPQKVLQAIEDTFKKHRLSLSSITGIASIDLKKDEQALIDAAEYFDAEFKTFSAKTLLNVKGEFSSSKKVQEIVGTDNVCERSAVKAAGDASNLIVKKEVYSGLCTVAVAQLPAVRMKPYADKLISKEGGWLAVVGIGPGGPLDMTERAHEALASSEVIIGYKRYVDLVKDEYPQAEIITSGMKSEIDRCRKAIQFAADGKKISMVCSGDAGIYGMSSLIFELMDSKKAPEVHVEVVTGVTAATSAAGILGAPISNDFAVVSLSDLLTPWTRIERRLHAAASGDFVIALYNPRSKGRPTHLDNAVEIISEYRDPDKTLCGWVKNAGRNGEEKGYCTLAELPDEPVDMLTTVIIGNTETRKMAGVLATPRGYNKKEEF